MACLFAVGSALQPQLALALAIAWFGPQPWSLLPAFLALGVWWKVPWSGPDIFELRAKQAPPRTITRWSPIMSPHDALDVLGLTTASTGGDLTKAHRKLMLQVHPDRGGNEALARIVNKARDILSPVLRPEPAEPASDDIPFILREPRI